MREKFRDFLKKNGLTQASVCRSLGVSGSALSQWLKGEYRGDNDTLEKKLENFMGNFIKKSKNRAEAFETKELSNFKKGFFIMDEAVINGEMAMLYGSAGTGKTICVKEYVKTHPEAILVEVIPGMSTRSVLHLVCEKLSINKSRAVDENVVAIANEFKRSDRILIIDEAENLTARTLDAIRRIWDFSSVPIILAGTYNLLQNLKGKNGELLRLFSRIEGRWEFRDLSEADAKLLFGDLSYEILKITTHLRRAANIYKKAKRFSKMANEKLSVSHIKMAQNMVILD